MIYFVSSNEKKYNTLLRTLQENDINTNLVKMYKMDIIEPQLDTIKDVSIYKANYCFEKLKKPVLVHDGGFYIDEYDNFPGVYTKFVIKTLGINGLLKLCSDLSNRKCYFKSVLTYKDKDTMQIFERTGGNGSIINNLNTKNGLKINENSWSDIWRIFFISKFKKTLFELNADEMKIWRNSTNGVSPFTLFAQWLKSNRRDQNE
mgnify:CR=1 FL=1